MGRKDKATILFAHPLGAKNMRKQIIIAALLAAVLPSPKRFRVDRPSPYVQQRQAWIMRQMSMLGGVRLLDSLDNGSSTR